MAYLLLYSEDRVGHTLAVCKYFIQFLQYNIPCKYSPWELLSGNSWSLRSFSLRVFSDFFMKVLMQDIWRLKIDWGEDLPKELVQLFDWYNGLSTVEGIRLSRGVRSKNIVSVREQWLRVFTNASSTGFGVAIYQCTYYNDDSVEVSFVVSKTHVATLKQRAIPELELKGPARESI